MGLDIYLDWDGKTEDDRTAQYRAHTPELYASAGYLRSSYNDSGFNSWARRMSIPTFYDLFGCEGEPPGPGWREERDERYDENVSRFWPDWQASRNRAVAALAQFETLPKFDVIRGHTPMKVFKTADIIPAFMQHRASWDERPDDWEAYSNREGMFFARNQPTVYALMWEQREWGPPLPVMIVADDHTYYRSVIEAVIGFIDLALTKPNPRMSWSG